MPDTDSSASIHSFSLAAEALRNVDLQAEILARITDGVIIVSAREGRILYNNPALEAMFGYGPGELIGQTPDVLEAPEGGSPAATAADIIRTLQSSGVWEGELLNRRKDGGTNWTHAKITTQELPQVGVIWLAIHRDITERKRMEMALQESQRQFADLVTGTPHLLLIQDAELRYTMIVNPQLGFAAEDIIGKTDSEFLTPADAEKLTIIKRQVLATGQSARVDTSLQSPAGIMEYFSGIYIPRLDAEGRPDGIIGYFENVTEKRAADAALAKSQLQFRTLVEGSGMLTWSCPPSGRHDTPQADLMAFTGLSAEESLGSGWTKVVHPDDLASVVACWEKALATGQPVTKEHRIRRHDGDWRWMSVHAVPLRKADGAIEKWFGINVDVTERKRTEEALRESQATLQSFFDSSPLMMGIAELAEGKTVAISGNLAMASFLEKPVEELCSGKTGLELGNSAEFERLWVEHYQRSQHEGVPVHFECEYPRADGSTWLSATVSLIGPGPSGHPRFSFVVEDITQRKRAEQALAASESLLRTITENSPDEIFFLDGRLNIEYLNPAALEVVRRLLCQQNVCLKDVMGRPFWELVGENSMTQSFRRLDEQVITRGEISCVEDVIDMGGSSRTLLTLRAPIRDSGGNVVGLVGIARDITERKHEEMKRLASLERQRDALVREVHHRIKNHLHGVLGLLCVKATAYPEVAPHLTEVRHQINAIAGVYELRCAGNGIGTDLDQVVRLIVAGATGPVAYQGLAGEPLALGDADAVPVALVVNELITNALKHRLAADPDRPARVTLERVGEDAMLAVSAGPARLPEGFDYATRQGLGIGLELTTTLLPTRGVRLAIFQEGDEVRAELRLEAPLFLQ